MRELQELSTLAKALEASLPRLLPPPEQEGSLDEPRREMLLSVRYAVDLTRGYIDCLNESEKPRSGHGSLALKHAWSSAGVELIRYDPELARKCVLKAFYWSGPEAWSE
ncbi:MAG: hypothetical protein ACOC5E_02415, partial [Acidobacteriota bacterium]